MPIYATLADMLEFKRQVGVPLTVVDGSRSPHEVTNEVQRRIRQLQDEAKADDEGRGRSTRRRPRKN
jgi:hypothetical protein